MKVLGNPVLTSSLLWQGAVCLFVQMQGKEPSQIAPRIVLVRLSLGVET